MKRQIALAISFVVISLTLSIGLLLYLKRDKSHKKDVNDAIDINFKDINENIINSASLDNKSTLIIFFNTQCDLCLSEMDFLSAKVDQISNQFNLIFISFEPKDSLLRFFEKYNLHNKINTYIISDTKAELLNYFEIEGYPSFVFLDKLRHIAKRGSAINEQTMAEILTLNTSN